MQQLLPEPLVASKDKFSERIGKVLKLAAGKSVEFFKLVSEEVVKPACIDLVFVMTKKTQRFATFVSLKTE